MNRVKHILFMFIACFLLGGGSLCAFAGDETEMLPLRSLSERKLAFQSGERLGYVVHYKWGMINSDVARGYISLDTVTLDGQKVFKARIYGRTAKFYDTFFRVREDFTSWFTVEGLRPVKFTRDTKEGGYYVYNSYNYMWDPARPHIKATIESKNKQKQEIEIPISLNTYDVPSIFFLARNLDFSKLKEGGRYPLVFAIDDDVFTIYLIYKGKESKYIRRLGNVNTLKFAATLVAGEIFDGKEDMYMWFTDDNNRIPVLFSAPIKIGEVSGYLKSYEGLKHPFDSFVKR